MKRLTMTVAAIALSAGGAIAQTATDENNMEQAETNMEQAGENMDAARAFTTIALFNLIRFPFAFLPMGIQQVRVNMKATCGRGYYVR